jgi:hypothetical protein
MSDVIEGQIVDDQPIHTEAPPQLSKKEREFVDSLRALADFYERRPGLFLPYLDEVNAFPDEKDMPGIVRRIGACEKATHGDSFFMLRKKISPTLTLRYLFNRAQVCERVVVGRETVEEKIPVTYETRVVTRDKVEWHCPKSIIDRPQIEAPAEPATPVPAASDEDIPF